MEKIVIAFDVGGTEIKFGVVTESGKILKKNALATATGATGDTIMGHLHEVAAEIYDSLDKAKYTVVGLGFGVPGLVDEETVLLGGCENVPGLHGMRFADIGDRFKLPTRAGNDATIAALGEVTYGAGKGYTCVLLATLGTGVGGGLVFNGKPFYGYNGYAGELGHVSIDPAGLECNCGSYGCLERYASANALVKRAKQKLRHELKTKITSEKLLNDKAKAVFDAAREGDKIAQEVIEEVGTYLGIGFSSVANLLNLDLILIGGGMSKGADMLIPSIKTCMKNYTLKWEYKHLELKQAQLGNDAGILGGAALFFGK